MYGHLYSPHLLYSEIATECYSVLVVFPAGILGYMPKPWADFFQSNLHLQSSVSVFSEPNSLSFAEFKHKHVVLVIIHGKRPTQKISTANKQASGETAAVYVTASSEHTHPTSSLRIVREHRLSPPLQVGIHLSLSRPWDSCPDSPSVCPDLCLGPWGEPKWPTKGVSGMLPSR